MKINIDDGLRVTRTFTAQLSLTQVHRMSDTDSQQPKDRSGTVNLDSSSSMQSKSKAYEEF